MHRIPFALLFAALAVPVAAQEPLVTRDRIDLNLAGAETILAAAKGKARELEVKVNIAVVDDGGHLVAFARMDGARPASGGKVTTLYGGVPIEIEGQIIGAVGVGGATGEQDALIARAGIAKLVEAIQRTTK